MIYSLPDIVNTRTAVNILLLNKVIKCYKTSKEKQHNIVEKYKKMSDIEMYCYTVTRK